MLDPQSLNMRPDSLHRGEIVTDGAIHLIVDDGCRAVTLRALGDRFNMTPRGVQCWFGATEKMWEQIAACYGRRWVGWILHRPRIDEGAPALLPTTSEEVAWTRVWLALGEEGRQRPAVGAVIAFFEQQEVDILQRLKLRRPGDGAGRGPRPATRCVRRDRSDGQRASAGDPDQDRRAVSEL